MKYKKRSNNIYNDYEYYICNENLFQVAFFGYKSNNKQNNKMNYIWNSLLKQYRGL